MNEFCKGFVVGNFPHGDVVGFIEKGRQNIKRRAFGNLLVGFEETNW